MSFIPTNISDPALAPLIEIQENIRQALAALDERVNGGPLFGHHATHEPGGGDSMAVNAAATTGSLRTLGTTALSAAAGTDSRLSDARTPLAHAGSHNAGGSDVLVIDAIAAVGSLRTLGAGAQQAMPGNASPAGRLIRAPQVLTSGTSYSKPAGCNAIFVRLLAGGGGGGGCSSVAAQAAAAGGGASGGYAEKYYANPPASCTYAIGAGGAAGSNAGGNGGVGGATTFTDGTTLVTANGGLGGIGQAAGTTVTSVLGGASPAVSTNGDLNGAGTPGSPGNRLSGTAIGVSGSGGDSLFGGPGSGLAAAGAGANAIAKGSGGGGGAVVNGSAAVVGGTGSAGVIIVEEYT